MPHTSLTAFCDGVMSKAGERARTSTGPYPKLCSKCYIIDSDTTWLGYARGLALCLCSSAVVCCTRQVDVVERCPFIITTCSNKTSNILIIITLLLICRIGQSFALGIRLTIETIHFYTLHTRVTNFLVFVLKLKLRKDA